jgi:hypothetical protein
MNYFFSSECSLNDYLGNSKPGFSKKYSRASIGPFCTFDHFLSARCDWRAFANIEGDLESLRWFSDATTTTTSTISSRPELMEAFKFSFKKSSLFSM